MSPRWRHSQQCPCVVTTLVNFQAHPVLSQQYYWHISSPAAVAGWSYKVVWRLQDSWPGLDILVLADLQCSRNYAKSYRVLAKQARKGRESRPWMGLAESFSTPALCEVGRGGTREASGSDCAPAGEGRREDISRGIRLYSFRVCFCVLFHSVLAVSLLLFPL